MRFDERYIPLGLKIRVVLGHPAALIGILFIIIGGLAIGLLLANSNWQGGASSDDPTVEAVIESVSGTGTKVNSKYVYAYEYRYTAPDGNEYTGTSYTEGANYQVGDRVTANYVADKMDVSTLAGMRDSSVPTFVFFIMTIFPVIGGAVGFFAVRRRIKALYLLRHGQVTTGQLIGKTPTSVTINRRRQYKLTFQFTVNGQPYTVDAYSHIPERLQDEPQEMLVYDQQNPSDAFMVDELPGVVKDFLKKQ